MQNKAIGFYWTLPVPWVGFRQLDDKDVDEAARQSRTIDLQRDIVRRWVKENGHNIIHEEAYIELSPDRASDLVRERLQWLVGLAIQKKATILFVDFGSALQQRHHHYLRSFVGEHASYFLAVAPPYDLEEAFTNHFALWRERQKVWMDGKPQRAFDARLRAAVLKAEGLSLPAIAAQLNAENLPSLTGKDWTGDNLRKLLKGD